MRYPIVILLCLILSTSWAQNKEFENSSITISAQINQENDSLKLVQNAQEKERKEALYKAIKYEAVNTSKDFPKAALMEPYNIRITTSTTTSLVFPTKIVAIDRGLDNILSKKVDGVENVLKIKASTEFSRPSNLTVITEDGRIYTFTVVFEDFTEQYVVDMRKLENAMSGSFSQSSNNYGSGITFNSTGMNSTMIENLSKTVLSKKTKVLDKEREHNIKMFVKQIFVKDGIVFFPVQILNQGEMQYDIDLVKFFVRDKKKVKRTVSQVLELEPLYVYNDKEGIERKKSLTQVFAFDKFTLTKDKKMDIILYEKNGGRNITCTLKYREINKAEYLN
jgi:conjugative transposon TraN protein